MSSLPRPAPAATPLPSRKPMASCRRVSLYQREIRVSPSSAARELLLEKSRRLSEGQRDGARFLGSTMLTLELGRVSALISDPIDASTARRLAEVADRDEQLKLGARLAALRAGERDAEGPLEAPELDVRVRANGTNVHIDVDVEGRLTARIP
jgi:hypothetical protein